MLVRFLVSWVFNTVALFVAAAIFRGISYGDDWWVLILAGAVFSAANLIVRPFVTFLAIPLIIITLGIALFFVNLLMLYLTSWIVSDFRLEGFWTAVGGTLVIWLVNLLLSMAFGRPEEIGQRRERRQVPRAN